MSALVPEYGQDLPLLLGALLLAGALVGFMSGLLGIGGGGILVPVLYEILNALGTGNHLALPVAIGTSLCVMIPTSIRTFRVHNRYGAGDLALLKRMGPWVLAGVIAGAVTARFYSGDTIKWLWVVFGSFLTMKYLFSRPHWRLADDLPTAPLFQVYSGLIGFVSTMMSIGGSAFTATFLTLHGRPLIQAVATAAGIGPLIAIPGTIGFIWAGWTMAGLPAGSLGYVNLLAAIVIIPVGYVMAPVGVRAAHALPARALELIFAGFLALVTLRFLLSLMG